MVSVTQAFAVDLTGQICSDQFQGEFYSGVSTQPDFIRSVSKIPGGKPIICLQSTTDDEEISRIRPLLIEGEGVTIPRSDVHYVVTEYGVVNLFGLSIRERALRLIEIAHPKFRSWLLEEAKRLGYVHKNQVIKSKKAYPVEEEREVILKNGDKVMLRPAKASDVQGLQDIFYHLSELDIYTRFFNHLRSFTEEKATHLCNVDYENDMAFIAALGERENEKIIGSSCYFLNQTTNLAEVAYMIRPEWQGFGLGTLLQKRMAEYAQKKGIRGFVAEVLVENTKMRKLAQNSPNVSMKIIDDVCEIITLF
jgi:RimJ/RimL family protein N-acetyltransferase